jgi:hypothetical protein
MKRGFGNVISFIEEIAFLGIVSLLVCFFAFNANFSTIVHGASELSTFSDYFFGYMFISLIGFPIIMILCILCQKYLGLYNREYEGASFAYILARNLYDDIAFPFYLIIAFFGVIFRIDRGDSKVGTIIQFVMWLINIVFILLGMLIAF